MSKAQTTLTRIWVIKMLAFCAVLLGFGFWGLFDALKVYPARGKRHADYALWQYLQASRDSGTLEKSAVADPRAELARLNRPDTPLSSTDQARLAWLKSLNLVGMLDSATLQGVDPSARLAQLTSEWTTSASGTATPKDAPPPLNRWDIPVQWVFVVVGLGGGILLLAHFFRVKSVRYGWEEAEQRLHLPDGATLVPADIEDFDKRKWDKYLIFLKVKPGHETHGGKELRLDLLHHTPLEEWVLAMERTAFPDRAVDEDEESTEPEPEPVAGEDEETDRSASSA